MTGDIVAVEIGRSTWQGPAQDAPCREAEWQPIGTAPKLTRIIVAGWQEPCGGVGGYWWFHEDWTDGTGVPVDHPEASLWVDMRKHLPSLPALPRSKGVENSPHQPDGGPALAVIDLIEGYASDGAFSRKVLVDAEVDNTTLLKALIESLKPFGPFLSDGKGVALIMDKDGKASIVGVSMLAAREGGVS